MTPEHYPVIIHIILIFQDGGSLALSLDANFGLVHKQNSGSSVEEPQLASQMFFDRKDVNDFMEKCDDKKKNKAVNFLWKLFIIDS